MRTCAVDCVSNTSILQFVGEEIRSGMPTLKYVRTTTTFKKKNTYTLYITKEKPHRPLRYVMHGRDTLLHSSYDHYVIDYLTFHPWKFDFEVMKIPKGKYTIYYMDKDLIKNYTIFDPMRLLFQSSFYKFPKTSKNSRLFLPYPHLFLGKMFSLILPFILSFFATPHPLP